MKNHTVRPEDMIGFKFEKELASSTYKDNGVLKRKSVIVASMITSDYTVTSLFVVRINATDVYMSTLLDEAVNRYNDL